MSLTNITLNEWSPSTNIYNANVISGTTPPTPLADLEPGTYIISAGFGIQNGELPPSTSSENINNLIISIIDINNHSTIYAKSSFKQTGGIYIFPNVYLLNLVTIIEVNTNTEIAYIIEAAESNSWNIKSFVNNLLPTTFSYIRL